MNSNLITGFHTRLEGSRKYLFGSACVYGENGADKHALQGVYLCRGDDWRPCFEVGPDFESWNFTSQRFHAFPVLCIMLTVFFFATRRARRLEARGQGRRRGQLGLGRRS